LFDQGRDVFGELQGYLASTGNESSTERVYPAALEGVLGVGATDRDDRKTDFSTSGDWVKLFAPGKNIRAIGLGGKLQEFSGTSYSATIVTGVAALVLEANPELKPEEVRSILIDSARMLTPTGSDPAIRRVDALAAVRAARQKK
jgi:subtilisin family serine protease